MSWIFGRTSERNLVGVDGRLVRVARRALTLSTVDFAVTDGVRTAEQQAAYVASGASWTANSRHLTGHAIDVAPWIDGKARWDWALFYPLAAAFHEAAELEGVPLRWGGVWDRLLLDLPRDSLEDEVASYVRRCRSAKPPKAAKIDGPHFEIPR